MPSTRRFRTVFANDSAVAVQLAAEGPAVVAVRLEADAREVEVVRSVVDAPAEVVAALEEAAVAEDVNAELS